MEPLRPRGDLAKDLLEAFTPHYQRMKEIDGWLEDSEATALFVAAASLKATNPVAVEIGSFQGKSSVCIAGGLQGGALYCIDPFDTTDQKMYLDARDDRKVSSLYGKFLANTWWYKNIRPCVGFSDIVQYDTAIPREIDMLFIDGNHSYKAVYNDVKNWVPRLKPGGVLAMHDVFFPTDPTVVDVDPIRVICDLGLGQSHFGWTSTTRVHTLFLTQRTEAPLTWLGNPKS